MSINPKTTQVLKQQSHTQQDDQRVEDDQILSRQPQHIVTLRKKTLCVASNEAPVQELADVSVCSTDLANS